MKAKFIVYLIVLFNTANVLAQSDTLQFLKFQGLQLEFQGLTTFSKPGVSRAELNSKIMGDDMLKRNLDGYTYNLNDNTIDYNASLGARAYFRINAKGKVNKEVFIGFTMRNINLTYLNYNKHMQDTLSTYTNPLGQKAYEIRLSDDSYSFSVDNKHILIPLGINFTTDKNKRFWFSLGAEIGAGITFSQTYHGNHFYYSTDYLVPENTTFLTGHQMPFSYQSKYIESFHTDFSGTGLQSYIAVPLGMNIRLSKKYKVLKNLSYAMSATPGYFFQNNNITGFHSGFSVASYFALRYDLLK